jgi:hypothetical protein
MPCISPAGTTVAKHPKLFLSCLKSPRYALVQRTCPSCAGALRKLTRPTFMLRMLLVHEFVSKQYTRVPKSDYGRLCALFLIITLLLKHTCLRTIVIHFVRWQRSRDFEVSHSKFVANFSQLRTEVD